MKSINKLKNKVKELNKLITNLEERYKLVEESLELLPQSQKDHILKIWNKDSWDENFLMGPLYNSLIILVKNYQDNTKLFKSKYEEIIESDIELKEFLVKENMILTQYKDSDIEKLKCKIEEFNNIKLKKAEELNKCNELTLKYNNAIKIQDKDKLPNVMSFNDEKSAEMYFKDNYKDYVFADYDGYGLEEVLFYIEDSLVSVNYDVEFWTHRDHNDNKYYAPERLLFVNFELISQEDKLKEIKENELLLIKEMEDKLNKLKTKQ